MVGGRSGRFVLSGGVCEGIGQRCTSLGRERIMKWVAYTGDMPA